MRRKELEELTGLTAEFGNDANVAALGEMWKGGRCWLPQYDHWSHLEQVLAVALSSMERS